MNRMNKKKDVGSKKRASDSVYNDSVPIIPNDVGSNNMNASISFRYQDWTLKLQHWLKYNLDA